MYHYFLSVGPTMTLTAYKAKFKLFSIQGVCALSSSEPAGFPVNKDFTVPGLNLRAFAYAIPLSSHGI